MAKHILEEIVTVFTGDTTAYDRAMAHVVNVTNKAAGQVQAAAKRIHRSIANTASAGSQPLSFASVAGGALPSLGAGKTRKGVNLLGALPRMAMGGMAAATNVMSNFFSAYSHGIRRMWYDTRLLSYGFRNYILTPILGLATASTYAFARFDDEIHKATALFGNVTEAQRKMMEQGIFKIAKGSRVGPQELAEQLSVLASANYTVAQSMNILGTAEHFAVASGMKDAAESTNLLIGVQSALGLRVQDNTQNLLNMTRVGNLLARANALASGEIEDFAKALTNKAAASLRGMGKDAEEGLAILAAFALQETKGAQAGTRFTIVMRDLQRQVEKHPKQWEAFLGKNAVFDTSEKMKGLVGILGNLSDRFQAMSDEQRSAAAILLGFNDRSSDSIKMLMGMGTQMRQFEKDLRNSDEAMEEMYQERMKSFMSQLRKLWSWIHVTGIELGKVLAPEILRLGEGIKSILKMWGNLSDSGKRSLLHFTGALVAFVAIAGVLAGIAGAIIVVVSALGVSGAIIAGLAGVIGAATFAMMGPDGLVSAFDASGQSMEKFGMNAVKFFDNFAANMIVLKDWMKDNWGNMIIDVFNSIGKGILNLSYNIVNAVGNTILDAEGLIYTSLNKSNKYLDSLLPSFMQNKKGFYEKQLADQLAGIEKMKGTYRGLGEDIWGGGGMTPMPHFHLLGTDENGNGPVDQIQEITNEFKKMTVEIRRQTRNPFNVVFESKGIDAVLAGSAEAFDIIQAHFQNIDPGRTNPAISAAYGHLLGAPDGMFAVPDTSGAENLTQELLTEIRDLLKVSKEETKNRPFIQLEPLRLQ